MRLMRLLVVGCGVWGGLGCSSASSTTSTETPATGAPAADAPIRQTIGYFEGTADSTRGTIALSTRGLDGKLSPEVTLPYGTASGNMFFHTCSTSLTASTFGGQVSAINLMTGTNTNVNAVIDSISESGVTLATGSGAGSTSGIIASYGTVAPNAVNCTSPTAWTFNIPGSANFTFSGHATGYANGLVAYWSFSEGTGTTFNDSSGNGQTATASSGSWVPGESGTGYHGTAVSNAVVPVTNTGITVSVWAKRTGSSGAGYPRILAFDGYALEIADYNNGGTLGIYTANTWTNVGTSLSSFVHIVVTATSSQTLVYANGSLVATLGGNSSNFSSDHIYFGQAYTHTEDFDGTYDEIRLYNRVLSATEVAAIP